MSNRDLEDGLDNTPAETGCLFGTVVIAVLVATLVYALVMGFLLWVPDSTAAGTFGDMFGLLNAVFSGIALAGVVLTVYLQTQQLQAQREELRATRLELEGSRKAQEALHRVQTLQYESLVSAGDPRFEVKDPFATGLGFALKIERSIGAPVAPISARTSEPGRYGIDPTYSGEWQLEVIPEPMDVAVAMLEEESNEIGDPHNALLKRLRSAHWQPGPFPLCQCE